MKKVDSVMGDWQGTITSKDGTKSPLVAQVMALGESKYKASFYTEFDTRNAPLVVLDGQLDGKKAVFTGSSKNEKWQGCVKNNKFSGSLGEQKTGAFVMRKVFRFSPTLGAKAPAGALVLFDGNNFDQWRVPVKWKLVGDGAMEVNGGSIITKKEFADFKLHMEFKTPFEPEAREQGRGNSGVYIQGRYEIQILDSYSLEGRSNECGGIYSIAAPRVNMCAPPLQWQTYDITFSAPRFDSAGKKIQNARITAIHNGVKIHDNVEVPKTTGGALHGSENKGQTGGIYLQDHGNPLQYRNIWLVELAGK